MAQKEHTKAIAALEKVLLKEKKANAKSDAKVAKLEKALKASQASADKDAKKIKKIAEKKAKIQASTKSRMTKAQTELKKYQSAEQKAQQKLQTATAAKAPPKTIYKLEDKVHDAERKVEGANVRLQHVDDFIRLESLECDIKSNAIAANVQAKQAKNQAAHRQAVYDRDLTLAKLLDDKAMAQLAVKQSERRLGQHKTALGAAESAHKEALAPVEEPVPEHAGEHEGGEGAAAEHGEEGAAHAEGGEHDAVPDLPAAPPAPQQ